jgi:hypothetical protein
MSDQHEPREAFVNQLEHHVRSAFHRRRMSGAGWWPQSRRRFVLAAAALVVVSMTIGGAIVAVAYEAQRGEQRGMLVETFEQRAELARRRLDLARHQLRDEEARVAIGVGDRARVGEARLKAIEAEAEVKLAEIDLAEVRATAREPMTTVSTPLVEGKDLVTDRWLVEMTVRAAAADLAKQNADRASARFDVGLANDAERAAANTRMVELQSAVQAVNQRLAIRQAFLKGAMSAAAADLRVLAAETELQRSGLVRRLEFAERQIADMKARRVGVVGPLEIAEAALRLQELQLAITKADYELELIRLRLPK